MHWPEGAFGTPLQLDGRARDLLTTVDGDAVVGAEQSMSVRVSPERVITDITVTPARPGVERLVGAKGGGALRTVIDDAVPGEREVGSPLYLLLDDIAGATLIAGFAWSRWVDFAQLRADAAEPRTAQRGSHVSRAENPDMPPRIPVRVMQGICSGFRPGSSALLPDGTMNPETKHNIAIVPPLAATDDPIGWHELDPNPPAAMRRARRIDVWHEGGRLLIDAMFRDSCWQPDGAEVAVREYHLDAVVDRGTERVLDVRAEPRVLPFAECPGAAPNAGWLAGAAVRELRTEVPERIQTTDCCTHLNDALRSLAEVPVLASALEPERLSRQA